MLAPSISNFEVDINEIEENDTHGFIGLMLARQQRMRVAWDVLKPMVIENTVDLVPLDPDQQAVVDLPIEAPFAASVIANAGTGKSYTTLRRVLAICLKHPNICPADFTLVAFNNKAAKQLHDKWFELTGLVASEDVPAPRCTTLHALGYLTTMSLRGKHGIISEGDKYKFVKNWLDQAGCEDNPRVYCDALEQIALSGITISGKYDEDACIDVGCRSVKDAGSIEPLTLMTLRRGYEAHKLRNNLLDFEDLALQGGILASQTSKINKLQLRSLHRFIIADEGQDIDKTQYNLIKNLTDHLIIIGDIKQTLYTWRQADPGIMIRHSLRRLFLTHNYRSDERIVRFGNRAHKLFPNKNPPSIATKGILTTEPAINISKARNPEHEMAVVAEKIGELLAAGADPDQIAVLTHTNNQCKSFEKAMFANRIPYRIKQHRTTIAESAEFLTLSALARLERDPKDSQALLTLAEHTKGIGEKTLQQMAQDPEAKIKNSKMREVIDRHKTMADRIAEGTPTGYEEKIAYWANLIQTNQDLTIDLDKLSESVNLMFEVVKRPTDPDLAMFSENPLDLIAMTAPDTAKGDKPKVTLSTVHATKGLEYDHVFLPYMNHNPYAPPARDPQEKACWLYVGLTRAKKSLTILFSQERNPPQQNFTQGRPMRAQQLEVNYELLNLLAE